MPCPGNVGIGHVRYPTAGSSSAQEAQPFFVNSPLGMYLIHNGNLTNTEELRAGLEGSQSFFNRHLRTDSDSEVSPSDRVSVTSCGRGIACLGRATLRLRTTGSVSAPSSDV